MKKTVIPHEIGSEERHLAMMRFRNGSVRMRLLRKFFGFMVVILVGRLLWMSIGEQPRMNISSEAADFKVININSDKTISHTPINTDNNSLRYIVPETALHRPLELKAKPSRNNEEITVNHTTKSMDIPSKYNKVGKLNEHNNTKAGTYHHDESTMTSDDSVKNITRKDQSQASARLIGASIPKEHPHSETGHIGASINQEHPHSETGNIGASINQEHPHSETGQDNKTNISITNVISVNGVNVDTRKAANINENLTDHNLKKSKDGLEFDIRNTKMNQTNNGKTTLVRKSDDLRKETNVSSVFELSNEGTGIQKDNVSEKRQEPIVTPIAGPHETLNKTLIDNGPGVTTEEDKPKTDAHNDTQVDVQKSGTGRADVQESGVQRVDVEQSGDKKVDVQTNGFQIVDNNVNRNKSNNDTATDTQSSDPHIAVTVSEDIILTDGDETFISEDAVNVISNDRFDNTSSKNSSDINTNHDAMLLGDETGDKKKPGETSSSSIQFCERVVPWGQKYHAKTSTYDLLMKANYTLDQNDNYPIPIKTVPELTADSDRDVVTVFLVPFSHADPGYGLTIEQYYKSKTHATLDNMIEKLTQYPNMTFQWAETVFLARWFQDLPITKQAHVRELIVRGQLEIVLGGWVMPDEASTHYVSVVDQLIEGHQWLLENLGVKPKQAWVNDPFGYSSTMPYLWKSTGMDNMVFLRIDQAVKAELMKQKSLEFNWRPYWKQTNSSDILATIMPYTNYWIGDVCGPDTSICNEFAFINMDKKNVRKVVEVTEENVAKQAELIFGQFLITADLYAYNSLYIGLGEDFTYTRPAEWDNLYKNYKKIMDYVNTREDWKMKIKFGTLSQYFDNVRKEQERLAKKADTKGLDSSKLEFPSISGDFYPYTEKKHEFWTGYYSTRPLNKRFSRELESLVRAADIFHVLTYSLFKHYWVTYKAYDDVTRDIQTARRELGMFLHHDGITGTSLPHVVRDYEARLFKAHTKIQDAFKTILVSLLSKGKQHLGKYIQEETVKPGPRNVMQKIKINTSMEKKLVLVNPISKRRNKMVTVCVSTGKFGLLAADGSQKSFQMNEWSTSRNDNCRTTVTFLQELPPFGIEIVTFDPKSVAHHLETVTENGVDIGVDKVFMIENTFMKIEFDGATGMMRRVIDRQGRQTNLTGAFLVYQSSQSGAYIFGPKGKALQFKTGNPTISVSRGSLVSEVNVKSPGLFISVKLLNTTGVDGHGIHIRTEIDMSAVKMTNMEVVLRFGTDVENDLNFFTDQNGYQLMGRRRRQDMPIEANYYPISTMILIEDNRKRVSLHTKQAHGASSLEAGQFEVMLDRHTFRDDGRGLGQGIYDNVKVNGDFIVQIEHLNVAADAAPVEPRYTFPTEDAAILNEMLQNNVFIYSVVDSSAKFIDKLHPLKQYELPCDVTVVGLRNIVKNNLQYNSTSLVLHRKSFFCNHDNVNNQCTNKNETVTMKSVFPKLKVKATETSLSHLYEKSVLDYDSNLIPEKMELRAFKLEF